ncbi:MAG: hypothetical protein KJ060_05625 [Candidatus Hydrogenedentes bacterium]|nr:hypothetical protein [Candidatus Hydrogenedentota bacterium]
MLGDGKTNLPTVPEVADSWVGLSTDDLYYYRFDLSKTGSGRVGEVFLHDDVSVLDIDHWVLDKRSIEIEISAASRASSGIESIKGKVVGSRRMVLEITGKDWEKTAVLFRESDWVECERLLKSHVTDAVVRE